MLKGVNFGFRPGVGTSESIAMIKHIIDISNSRKSPLFAAILDVEAAYDKVPKSAIYAGLKRLHVPQHIVNLLDNMESTRRLQVDTPFGLTKEFRPVLGLAQGSLLSPLLWNIFYNPLLLLLQQNTQGFKPNENDDLRIASVAYADDLIPIATTVEELQMQLDIIHDFLRMYNMKMNVNKTHILTNLAQTHGLHPVRNEITLGGVPIPSVKQKHELSRILGVFLSMDGDATTTVDHAISTLKNQINLLSRKHLPSQVAINIINSVLISKILYRLQVTTVTDTKYKAIDTLLRVLTRRKAGLPKNTPNEILYDKTFGLHLQEFRHVHQAQLITNTTAMSRSENIIGEFLKQALK